jgi:uncharacterized protein YkwD
MQFTTHIRAVLVAAFAAILLVPAAGAGTHSPRENGLLAAMNATRAAHGLGPLRADAKLLAAARAHSRTLLRSNTFTHGSLGPRLSRFGVVGPKVGENLAWGVGSRASAASIVSAWLRSPGHRANLLRPGFTRVGVGALTGSFAGHGGATLVTADFAGR